ncbi:uncharacterized protein LOC116093113 [Mastomys coucha]|uniref:uncharacterized protein LOC116093113 n=1 Tax=Mastomys coucha TaxID=35658 RepID=UPI0012621EFB|nr:uncharacterized protein LOC116093113 [Mastomys coucha]
MGSWTSRTSMIRPQKRRGKDATADGSELGNLGWIQAAPSLTAHFPRPPPRCRRRVPSALVERLRGLSCHPGRPQGAEAQPSPTSHGVHTLLWKVKCELRVGAAEPSSQSFPSYRLQGSSREAPDGNPSPGEPPRPREKPMAGGGVGRDPETPRRLSQGQRPHPERERKRERWASSQDVGLRVRAEGDQAGTQSPGPTEPRGRRFCTKSSRNHPEM